MPILTKFGSKHSWERGVEVCSNEGPQLFQKGNDRDMVKFTADF